MHVNNKDLKQKRKGQGGFTLIELIVAVGIMVILAAVATPFLLGHVKDAKVASLNEQLLNVKTAFDSAFTASGGLLKDSDDGGDNYLDDLVENGWLSNDPTGKNELKWYVKKKTDSNKLSSYYIEIETNGNSGYEYLKDIIAKIDNVVDGSDDATSGIFQYNEDSSSTNPKINAYYLLYKDSGMTDPWH